MNAPRLPPGTIVAGKYTIQSELGRGATSATYAAIAAPGREMVLRVIAAEACDEAKVNALRALQASTANVPEHLALRVVEDGRDDATGAWFLATPRSAHPSLAELVALCPFEAAEAAAFLTSLARACSAMHACGVAHLGLHPRNVFVGPAPERAVRIADLSARRIDRATPPWAAPEQLEGGDGTIATDTFAVANLAFYALTGKPYADATPDDRAKLPPDADAVLTRALATAPGDRFASVAELHAALATALGGRAPAEPLFLTAPPPPVRVASSPSSPALPPPPSSPVAPALTSELATDDASDPPPPSVAAKGLPWRAMIAAASFFAVLGATVALVLRARDGAAPAKPTPSAATQVAAPPPSAAPVPPPPPLPPTPKAAPPEPPTHAPAVSAEPPAPASSSGPTIALRPNEGELLVVCEPQCGLVLVDGKQLMAYPRPAAVRAGNHGIGVSKPGHGGQWKPVTVVKGTRTVVRFTLTPVLGGRGKG